MRRSNWYHRPSAPSVVANEVSDSSPTSVGVDLTGTTAPLPLRRTASREAIGDGSNGETKSVFLVSLKI